MQGTISCHILFLIFLKRQLFDIKRYEACIRYHWSARCFAFITDWTKRIKKPAENGIEIRRSGEKPSFKIMQILSAIHMIPQAIQNSHSEIIEWTSSKNLCLLNFVCGVFFRIIFNMKLSLFHDVLLRLLSEVMCAHQLHYTINLKKVYAVWIISESKAVLISSRKQYIIVQ